jgi:hypothetical protein
MHSSSSDSLYLESVSVAAHHDTECALASAGGLILYENGPWPML